MLDVSLIWPAIVARATIIRQALDARKRRRSILRPQL